MGVEVEKKYRLTSADRQLLQRRLAEIGARQLAPEVFEENTLYAGHGLDAQTRVLRLRRTPECALFTFKERSAANTGRTPSAAAVKRYREDETQVGDPEALAAILDALGYRPAVVYEKRRTTWQVGRCEVVVDELPFGLFVEIEGDEQGIEEAERLLHLIGTEAVHETYPELAARHGTKTDERVEARFRQQNGTPPD